MDLRTRIPALGVAARVSLQGLSSRPCLGVGVPALVGLAGAVLMAAAPGRPAQGKIWQLTSSDSRPTMVSARR